MNSNAESKFIILRKRLDQKGYREPLGIESLPLVEKLLSDLIRTTESRRNAQPSVGKTEENSQNFDAVRESDKAEYVRVVRENNKLHLKLLKLREKDRATQAYPVQQPDDPCLADLQLLADGRIHELQEDIVKVKLNLENAQDFIKHLQSQGEERDKEIERLNHALQGGRPHDVLSLQAQNISNEKLVSQLQIEYLQETNRTLEQKIVQQKKEHLSTQVVLCEVVSDIKNFTKQLDMMDKELVLETANMDLQEATAQDGLKLVRGMDTSAGVLELKELLKRVNVKLGQITADRDLLIERLKVAQTSVHTGRDAEQQRNVDLENNIKILEQERVALQSQLRLIKEEAAQQMSESSALRSQQEEMKQTLSDAQHRLSVKVNELHNAYVQIINLEQKIAEQSSKHNEEVAALQESVSSLNKEKAALHDKLDQMTVLVQEEQSKKVDMRLTVQNMDSSLAQLQEALEAMRGKLAV